MSRLPIILLFLFPSVLFSQSAMEYFTIAQRKMIEDDIYSSLEYFSKSIEVNPDYHLSLFGMAKAYFRLSEYEAALTYIERARQLSRNNFDYLNLKGRIKVGLGEMEESYNIFSEILLIEPNNMLATLGIAEINLIENRYSEAEIKYNESLSIFPESKRALLSLLILYDSQGEYDRGDSVLKLLNQYYSYELDIKLAATEHYYRSGQIKKAEESGTALLTLDPDYIEIKGLMAKILLKNGDAEKAAAFLEEELQSDKNNLELRYLLAISYNIIGKIAESIYNFDFILKKAPYDEICRLAAETVAIENRINTKIIKYGDYHFDKGNKYAQSFLYGKALAEYRRGLKINPESIAGRLAYAEIYKKRGYIAKYIDILNLLEWNGFNDKDFLAKKEQMEHLKDADIADDWGVDQFAIMKNQYVLDIYIKSPSIESYHNMSDILIADYFKYKLEKFSRLNQNKPPQIIKDDTEAYKFSHKTDSDYYVILNFSETERIFSLNVSIYLSNTGVLVKQFSVLRAGNNKIADSIAICAESLHNFFPLKGSIVTVNDKKALINLGKLDGVLKDERFLIVRRDKARYVSSSPWYEVSDEDKLGIFIVEETDETVSEGVIENPGLFDLVNQGDEIFIIPDDQELILKPDFGYDQNLKQELLKLY